MAGASARREVPTLIGLLADLDTAGGDIANAFAEDALAFAKWHLEHDGTPGELHIVRLGLTREQTIANDLLDQDQERRD